MLLYPYHEEILQFFDKYGDIVIALIAAIVIFIGGRYAYTTFFLNS